MTTVIDRYHNPQRLAGSLRDPSGYVFTAGGRVFRAIDDTCQRTLRRLQDTHLLEHLIQQGIVVASRFIESAEERAALTSDHPGYRHFLEHAVLWPITFPCEWTVSMLADAGVHTLELQRQLLTHGYSLKDATAYNVQFSSGKPLFIDLPSIEEPLQRDVWYALGQFQRMFTYPLLLCRYHGWDLKSYFLSRPDGRDVEELMRCLGWWQRWHPRWWLEGTLPWLLGRQTQHDLPLPPRGPHPRSTHGPQAQLWNLCRLRRKIAGLAASYRLRGVWKDYEVGAGHSEVYRCAKREQVEKLFRTIKPQRVLDIGCNTGEYSWLAAQLGAQVIAVDADHDAVEQLYRQLKHNRASITPLVADVANPTPALGHLNQERSALLERIQGDCVLALALLHHLVVQSHLPLSAVIDLFARLTTRWLILEFVPPQDAWFQRLLRFRSETFAYLDLTACRTAFARAFTLVGEFPLPGSARTLLLLQKKG